MKTTRIRRFMRERDEQNEILLRSAGRNLKRFLNLDMHAYEEGVLSRKTKEMIGLVASLVLRCDDCILYHLARCREEAVSSAELMEALEIGLVVGGSITIPHIRRAVSAWEEAGTRSRKRGTRAAP